MKKDILICECEKIPTKSDKNIVLNKCKCKSSRRKEREYEQVVINSS